MVYCGKPSRGCLVCRQRRIKCDEGKPTCNQCQKSRRVCPGYKDDFDLVFRNENQALERRARKTTGKRNNNLVIKPSQTTTQQNSNSGYGDVYQHQPTSGHSTDGSVTTIRHAMTVPLEQRATTFFLSNFVLVGTNRAWYDYVIPLIASEPANSPLQIAFSAVSMASLGTRPNAKQLLLPAHDQYNKAMRQVNIALRDPKTQLEDATVGSVLLLGLFEVITSRRISATAWGTHIDGAVQILQLRGKDSLKTPLGTSLFQAIRTQMIVNCLTTSKRPPGGAEWWLEDAPKDEYGHKVTQLHLKAVDLRAEINDLMTVLVRTPETQEKVTELMFRAQDLDNLYADFVANVPDDWKYETVTWEDTVSSSNLEQAEVCPGKVDLYSDIFVIAVWNNLRTTRLLLGGMIVRCAAWLCHPVDYRTTPEYACALRIGADMITDICASIPFALGWKMARNGELLGIGMSGRYACGDNGHDSRKGLGGIMAIWPLFSASCSDFATDTQRKWIHGRLKYISEVMGVDQAKTFAHYQLRLPSMIVKRDGFALLQQAVQGPKHAEKSKAKAQAASENAGRFGTIWKFPEQNSRNSGQRTPERSPASTLQNLQPAYTPPPPQYHHQTHSAYPSPPTMYNTNPYANNQTYAPASFSGPYRNGSIISLDGSIISQNDNTPNNYSHAAQIDYEPPQQLGYIWPTNAIPSNTYTYPQMSNQAAYTRNMHYQQQLMEMQRQEHEAWAQEENEKNERERIATIQERQQREVALKKSKNELVEQAAGSQGTETMRKVMANYLAVDGMNVTS